MQLAKLWSLFSLINLSTDAFYHGQELSRRALITKTTLFEKLDKLQPTDVYNKTDYSSHIQANLNEQKKKELPLLGFWGKTVGALGSYAYKNSQNSYQIKCTLASIDLKPVIKNLARFYVYEFSRYTGEDFPKDGLLEAFETSFHFDNYWNNKDHYPFIFHVDDQIAGFALVNKNGSTIDVDWYLAEFYIVAKFQNKGIGRYIATDLLTQFSGTWELSQIPNNHLAVAFWRKVLQQLTDGQYTETLQEFQTPHPHQMLVHQFQCQKKPGDALINNQSY